jgi:hypothetical protein
VLGICKYTKADSIMQKKKKKALRNIKLKKKRRKLETSNATTLLSIFRQMREN